MAAPDTTLPDLALELRQHRQLCEEVLALARKEHLALRSDSASFNIEAATLRKNLLAKLTSSLDKIRQQRVAWLRLEPTARQLHPEITELLRETQNLVMKILVLDRENEQGLLRKGLIPHRQLPPSQRQQPHFVANLYQRNSAR